LGRARKGDTERWYEVAVGAQQDGLRHAHAQPINRIIATEDNLRNVIGALSQTLDALPTGLAAFDANQQLVTFNAAFLEMTSLDSTWLAGHPQLRDVLDTLREYQHLPEPRDWHAWRDQITGLDGTSKGKTAWSESWTLPSGQTFRLKVTCQPDRTVALLLDDVTAEPDLALKQQTHKSLATALLDRFHDAAGAFDQDGHLLHMNAQLAQLVSQTNEAPVTFDCVVQALSLLCEPSSVLDDLQMSFAGKDWSETVQLKTGGPINLRVSRLKEGQITLRAHTNSISHSDLHQPVKSVSSSKTAARLLIEKAQKPTRHPRVG
jgi:PAS domain-containing protein